MNLSASSILFIGSNSPSSTSRHRLDALLRLGYCVTVIDPSKLTELRYAWQKLFHYRSGYIFLQKSLLRALQSLDVLQNLSPDLVWIDSGELCGPRILKFLASRFSCPLVLYNVDDPTGSRDGKRFYTLKSALPLYTLCVFVRPETSLEALALGARRVLTVHRSYDEVIHLLPAHSNLSHPPISAVTFVGALIPGERRDYFIQKLINAGLPVCLYGNRWHKSPYWHNIKHVHKGPSLVGEAYSQALHNSFITLGLLSHGNRDLVTQRSFETLASRGLFCAERTSEHQLLYENKYEAVFWDSIADCINYCSDLLDNSEVRSRICENGANRIRELGVGNEDICRQIISSL